MADDLQRWKFRLAYDGAPWQGWQSQLSGLSVQDQVEAAFAAALNMPVSVQGSGRTDAGVHALAQVMHCDVPAALQMQGTNWVRAVNTKLPRSIRLLDGEPVDASFHARFSAKGKVYRYRISRAAVLSPFDHGRAWHVFGDVDLDAMRACATLLPGTHNFARLSANRGDMDEATRREDIAGTTRTMQRAELAEHGDELTFEIEGDGFLYKMVRLITGALVHVARGRASVAWFEDLLRDPSGVKNHHCAPADGLYLVRVLYGMDQR